jgi:alkylation response protein AidB-like acyl-CoA dehydrogenase
MSFAPTPEQEELRAVVRSYLADKSSERDVRRLMETDAGYDPEVWRQMAQQQGLQGLALPEEHGGSGFGFQEVGIVLEEMGRALLCSPYFSTVVLAATALMASGDAAAQKELLPQIAEGELLATLADVDEDLSAPASAAAAGNAWTVTGTKVFVLDGHVADVLLVSASDSLFLVDGTASGVQREVLPTLDATRKQARIRLSEAPAMLLGENGDGIRVLAYVRDIAAAGLAAEQVGVASRSLEMAVSFAKERVQFDRPIGSFQAVKHHCANMLIQVTSASAAAGYATWTVDHAPEELPLAASLAQAYCSDAAWQVAEQALHLHGGIGYTWEHPAHLYFKRAKSAQVLFGSPAEHRRRVAQHLGL